MYKVWAVLVQYLLALGHNSSSHGHTWKHGSSASCPPRETTGLYAASSWGRSIAWTCRRRPELLRDYKNVVQG
jgi:hypothetical protein